MPTDVYVVHDALQEVNSCSWLAPTHVAGSEVGRVDVLDDVEAPGFYARPETDETRHLLAYAMAAVVERNVKPSSRRAHGGEEIGVRLISDYDLNPPAGVLARFRVDVDADDACSRKELLPHPKTGASQNADLEHRHFLSAYRREKALVDMEELSARLGLVGSVPSTDGESDSTPDESKPMLKPFKFLLQADESGQVRGEQDAQTVE